MAHTEIARDAEDLESWVNATQGNLVLQRFGETGRIIDVLIQGGRKVQITPRERRHNSEIAASKDLDFFRNGMLQPVRLLDEQSTDVEVANNPNILGENEMKTLLTTQWKSFEKRVGDITSPTVLNRLHELAVDPQNGASVRTLQVIKSRLSVISGEAAGDPGMDEVENIGEVTTGIDID